MRESGAAGDFSHPDAVPAPFKFGLHEDFNQGFGQLQRYKSGWKTNDIGIVMLPDELGDFSLPAKSGTDMLVFVSRHADSIGGTAKQDAETRSSVFDTFSYRMSVIRIID